MPVTIKKNKTGVKTIRTKRPAAGAKKTGESAAPSTGKPAEEQAQQTQAAPPAAVQPEANGHNYGIDVTVAMVALLTFIVLIFVQVSEMSYYSAYPSVWPSPAAGLQSSVRRSPSRPARAPDEETEDTDQATNETDNSDFS